MTSSDVTRDTATSPSTATPRVVSSSQSRSQSSTLDIPLPPPSLQPSRGQPTSGGRRNGEIRRTACESLRRGSTTPSMLPARGDRRTEQISGEPQLPYPPVASTPRRYSPINQQSRFLYRFSLVVGLSLAAPRTRARREPCPVFVRKNSFANSVESRSLMGPGRDSSPSKSVRRLNSAPLPADRPAEPVSYRFRWSWIQVDCAEDPTTAMPRSILVRKGGFADSTKSRSLVVTRP